MFFQNLIRYFFSIIFILSLFTSYVKPFIEEKFDKVSCSCVSDSEKESEEKNKEKAEDNFEKKKYYPTGDTEQTNQLAGFETEITLITSYYQNSKDFYFKEIPTPPPDFI